MKCRNVILQVRNWILINYVKNSLVTQCYVHHIIHKVVNYTLPTVVIQQRIPFWMMFIIAKKNCWNHSKHNINGKQKFWWDGQTKWTTLSSTLYSYCYDGFEWTFPHLKTFSEFSIGIFYLLLRMKMSKILTQSTNKTLRQIPMAIQLWDQF